VECDVRTCLHGGTCRSDLTGFSCECSAGYTGRFCELGESQILNLNAHFAFPLYSLKTLFKDDAEKTYPKITSARLNLPQSCKNNSCFFSKMEFSHYLDTMASILYPLRSSSQSDDFKLV